jgi:hypothetical protein
MVFTDIALRSVFSANYRLAKFADRQRVCAVLYEKKTGEKAVNFRVHEDGGRPST